MFGETAYLMLDDKAIVKLEQARREVELAADRIPRDAHDAVRRPCGEGVHAVRDQAS